jgi:tetratricopeptide (TPR) repeat protein
MNGGIASIAAGLLLTALAPCLRPVAAPIDDALACGVETARAEQRAGIPELLLHAISLVESGRWNKAHKARLAWPWTVNVDGVGHVLQDKASAIELVRTAQAKGARSIDVGCMQVNLQSHPAAFRDLDEAFDPAANVAYATGFLVRLHERAGNWPKAAAYYHSRTPLRAAVYEAKVADQWGLARQRGDVRLQLAGLPPTVPAPEATPTATAAAAWFAKGRNALLAQDYAAAEDAILRAIALDRGNALYLDALGVAAAARGDLDRALAAYRMAIAIDRHDGFAWYNTAVIHWNAGRGASAIDAFRRAGLAYAAKGDIERAALVLTDLQSLSEGETL